jgi:hypothetical protein
MSSKRPIIVQDGLQRCYFPHLSLGIALGLAAWVLFTFLLAVIPALPPSVPGCFSLAVLPWLPPSVPGPSLLGDAVDGGADGLELAGEDGIAGWLVPEWPADLVEGFAARLVLVELEALLAEAVAAVPLPAAPEDLLAEAVAVRDVPGWLAGREAAGAAGEAFSRSRRA